MSRIHPYFCFKNAKRFLSLIMVFLMLWTDLAVAGRTGSSDDDSFIEVRRTPQSRNNTPPKKQSPETEPLLNVTSGEEEKTGRKNSSSSITTEDSGDETSLKHEPYPPSPPSKGILKLSLARLKQARKGNSQAVGELRAWISQFKIRNYISHSTETVRLLTTSSKRLRHKSNSINDLEVGKGVVTGKSDQQFTKRPNKVQAFLRYLEKYTFQNQKTRLQIGGMIVGGLLGGIAAVPDIPVLMQGILNIIFHRMNLNHQVFPPTPSAISGSYIGLAAFCDNAPRMADYLSRFCAPSVKNFSVSRSKLKEVGRNILIAAGSFIPVALQIYFLIDAEKEFREDAKKQGKHLTGGENYLYIWGPFYALEAIFRGFDQMNIFVNWAEERFFKSKIPTRGPSSPEVQFRMDLLKGLEKQELLYYWMPESELPRAYEEVFDPGLETKVRESYPGASQKDIETILGLTRLQSIVEKSQKLQTDMMVARKHYSKVKEVSGLTTSAVLTSPRALGIQVMLLLMLGSQSAAWCGAGLLGLFLQAAFEYIGTVRFLPTLLNPSRPGQTALGGLRIGATVWTAIDSIVGLFPLVSLYLDTNDKFFRGDYYTLLLFAAPTLTAYCGEFVTRAESWVGHIPTLFNRCYNACRRKRGKRETVGYMRDELILMVRRAAKVIRYADNDILAFIRDSVAGPGQKQQED